MKKKVIYHTSITLNESDQAKYKQLIRPYKIIDIFREGLKSLENQERKDFLDNKDISSTENQ